MSPDQQPNPEDYHLGEWLQGTGPDNDIAVCTRVRFARNVKGYSFSPCLKNDESNELTQYLNQALTHMEVAEPLQVTDLTSLDDLDRQLLMERHLISRDHATVSRPRSVLINAQESVSVMINEEDHIRSQIFHSGLQVEETFAAAENLDKVMMDQVPMAFSEEFGFLTACPTNAGTGMRVSVMLHLPGLVWANEIDKATNTAQKINLAVRGNYGEGSRAVGDFYQVSNQVTLGRTEAQILNDVDTAVQRLVEWEREVRGALLQGSPEIRTQDRIHRAWGTLQNARILTSDEALTCLSALRFGIQQGVVEGPSTQQLNRAMLLSQPAHLQRTYRQVLEPDERDQRRASLLRQLLKAQ